MKNIYLLVLACLFTSVMSAQDFTLRILHNNDGESMLAADTIDGMKVGGAPEFKTVVDSLRAEGTPNITLSSGDNFLAGVAFSASLDLPADRRYYDAIVIDSIGYDAIAIGNHDFDFGPDVLGKFIRDIQGTMPPYLSANLDFSQEDTLQTLVDAGRIAKRTILDIDGEQIGVFSLITDNLRNISSPRDVQIMQNLATIAQAQVDSLTDAGVNKIILISHLQGIDAELDLISMVSGIDIVIAGGGDELLTNDPSIALEDTEVFGSYPLTQTDMSGNTVQIVTTPGNYRYVGNLIVTFDAMGNVDNVDSGSDLVPVFDKVADPTLQSTVVDSILAFSEELRNNIIATTEVALDGRRSAVRTQETNQGNLVADGYVFLVERDRSAYNLADGIPVIGVQNGGGMRDDEITPAGDIAEIKTFDILPFPNNLVIIDHQFNTAEIDSILEQSVSAVEQTSGRFLQVSGIEFTYDPRRPAYDRVLSAQLSDGTPLITDSEPVESATTVYIATNSFTAGGGDGYDEFEGKDLIFTPFSYQQSLFEYITDGLNAQITGADYPEGGEGRINEAPFTLRIMHNNDGESMIVADTIGGTKVGGAAEFKTVVDSLRAEGTPNLMLSSGDNFLAGVAFSASLDLPADRPYYDAVVIDSLKYDAIAIGNHDFDFGPDVLGKFIRDIRGTMPTYLNANLDFSQEDTLQTLVDNGRIAKRTILDVAGEQVGVFSLITENLDNISSPRRVEVMEGLATIAQEQIDSLTDAGINKIILISHLQGIDAELDLIGMVSGIDIVIAGGGDELLTNDPSIALEDTEVFGSYPLTETDMTGNEVQIVTTPGNYRYVGNLIIEFDEMGNVSNVDMESDLVPVFDRVADADIVSEVTDSILAFSEELRNNIIAFTEPALDGQRSSVRTQETNQGNLVADGYVFLVERDRADYDLEDGVPVIGVQNGGGMRDDEVIPANSDVAEIKTFDILPFPNNLVIIDYQFNGEEIDSILEQSVSAMERTSGRFLQVSGIEFVWDPTRPAYDRVVSAQLSDGTPIIENYEVVNTSVRVYIATNSFTAGGGDGYDEFEGRDLIFTPFSYQQSLFAYITEGLNGQITAADYPEGGEGRIQQGVGLVGNSSKMFDLFFVSSFETGIFDEGAAEILDYDPVSQRVFFTNADANTVTILDISDVFNPSKVADIDMSVYGSDVNSVDYQDGVIAVAAQAELIDANGRIVFFDTAGTYINDVEVGVLPDMVTFTPDGQKVISANEGEPSDDYLVDPEGTVSIIDVSGGIANATVTNITFESLNADREALIEAGVRIFGPGASVAQDLEPEYVAVTDDNAFALVALQENNALAKIDLTADTLVAVVPLGFKDHSLLNNGMDASNRLDSIRIQPWPTLGMYQPDAIKSVTIDGIPYIVSANEGDARDYDDFSEETRVEDILLDSVAYPNFAELQMEENLGRLSTTNQTGDIDGDDAFEQIYSYGARSFSIWDTDGNLVFDSRNKMETVLAELLPENFNSNNDENDSFKSRSDDKGPEPEAIEIVELDGDVFALVGLERVGGVMVFDITDVNNVEYVNYVNNRDFSVMDATSSAVGDLGPEDIVFVPADQSPFAGTPLVLVANEVSGTVSIFAVNEMISSTEDLLSLNELEFRVAPNPFRNMLNVQYELPEAGRVELRLVDFTGRTLRTFVNENQLTGPYNHFFDMNDLPEGIYLLQMNLNGKIGTAKVVKQ